LTEVLGYLFVGLGLAAWAFGAYALVPYVFFVMRRENQIRGKFLGLPTAGIKDEAKFNSIFARVFRSGIFFVIFSAIGAYLLSLSSNID
jgi:hypothetical protein